MTIGGKPPTMAYQPMTAKLEASKGLTTGALVFPVHKG